MVASLTPTERKTSSKPVTNLLSQSWIRSFGRRFEARDRGLTSFRCPRMSAKRSSTICRGRPICSQRRLSIRSCAPLRCLSRQAIGGLVRAASVRAGLPPHGPHRLRHTVATGLLRRGAPLTEIAQLLRHRTDQTTSSTRACSTIWGQAATPAWPGSCGLRPPVCSRPGGPSSSGCSPFGGPRRAASVLCSLASWCWRSGR